MKKLYPHAIVALATLALPQLAGALGSDLCNTAAPGNPCILGNGSATTDCHVEWQIDGTKAVRLGIPINSVVCYEGDPRCDADADLLNGQCRFRAKACLNNHDPRKPTCLPSDVASMEIGRPLFSLLHDAADSTNLATLESVFNSDLGVPITRAGAPYLAGSTNASADVCSAPFELVVPLGLRSSGALVTGTKGLRFTSSTTAGTLDRDTLKLICRKSTCGNLTIQSHETCDDGNRNNGDGCDQACQIETGPSPTPTVSPTVTPTIPSPTPSVTASPTETPTPSSTATITATPSTTATPTATIDDGIEWRIQPGGGSAGSCRGTCSGGTNPGASCLSNGNCGTGGTCLTKKCVGGPLHGVTCAGTNQCNGCTMSPPQGSCAVVQSSALSVRVPLNGLCVPRTGADVACTTNIECAAGKTCQTAKLNVVPGAQDPMSGAIPLTVPQSSVVLNPAVVAGIGTVCVAAAGDGLGQIDCDGGEPGLNTSISVDHNTTPNNLCLGGINDGAACTIDTDCPAEPAANAACAGTCQGGKRLGLACTTSADCPDYDRVCNQGNSGTANGLADDPTCSASFLNPDGSTDYACKEGTKQCSGGINQGTLCTSDAECPGSTCTLCNSTSPHAGVCNSPTQAVRSGTFGAGDVAIALPLTIVVHANSSTFGPDGYACTADDTPATPPAAVRVVLSTGTNSMAVYDAGNTAGQHISPTSTCTGVPCNAQVSGVPTTCSNLLSETFTGTKLGGGFPAVDANGSLGDLVTSFQFVAE